MPWKTEGPMEQKMKLVIDWQSGGYCKSDLSQKYYISRKTVDKWINRYHEYGIDGLRELSRAPMRHPNQTSEDIVKLLIEEKCKNRKRGPKKIRSQLQRRYPGWIFPAASTIGDWLKKYGLVQKRKRRLRVPPYTEPFEKCINPNEVWSADYKGQFHMHNRRVCYPLTISDNYSRYLIACQGLEGPRYQETRAVFETVFRKYGLPDAIRTDNGTPFAGKCVGGLSRLSIWWIQLGIVPERIDKGCPEQNGRHERIHRTLKEEALESVAKNMKDQQRRFDLFCTEYNDYRPHESLGQDIPRNYYRKSTRTYVEKPVVPEYDYRFTVRHVRSSGDIKWDGKSYFLTELLAGQPVGLEEVNDGKLKVYYSFYPIGIIDLRKKRVFKLV